MAVYSFPANPVPAELYQFLSGNTGSKWLPWYIWGGGVYSTKYGYDTTKFIGYLGTISVPIAGTPTVTHFRLKGYASFKSGTQEGALIVAEPARAVQHHHRLTLAGYAVLDFTAADAGDILFELHSAVCCPLPSSSD